MLMLSTASSLCLQPRHPSSLGTLPRRCHRRPWRHRHPPPFGCPHPSPSHRPQCPHPSPSRRPQRPHPSPSTPTPLSPPNANACVAPNANALDTNPHRPHHLRPHHLNVNVHVAPNANTRIALDVNALVTCQRPRLPPTPTYPTPSSPLNANTLDTDAHVSPHCQRASPPAPTPLMLMPMSPANAHALVSPQHQRPQCQRPQCQRPCLLPMPTRSPPNADAVDCDAYVSPQCPRPCLPPTPMPLSPPRQRSSSRAPTPSSLPSADAILPSRHLNTAALCLHRSDAHGSVAPNACGFVILDTCGPVVLAGAVNKVCLLTSIFSLRLFDTELVGFVGS
ncbi:hypothetical protein OF83DRAFT_1180809 [Amylostereum chailletii]|nr:hypothetical protein OF83DRAFT_1180809 [Amylostereum chailletii]